MWRKRALAATRFAAAALATAVLGAAAAPADPPARGDAGSRVVTVAAASDVQPAFDDLAKAFTAERPDIVLRPTFGASGTFYAQIENRAPFDVFLSADSDYPRRLREKGLVLDSEFQYAQGRLGLWLSRSLGLTAEAEGLAVLRDARIRHVAIANPQHAPYGRAAEAALRSAGLYDAVKEKLVLGENVAQAAHFARSGAADAALVSLSLAGSPAMREEGQSSEVPPGTYPALDQAGVLLSWAQDADAARAFRDFLRGPKGREILSRHGLSPPGA